MKIFILVAVSSCWSVNYLAVNGESLTFNNAHKSLHIWCRTPFYTLEMEIILRILKVPPGA